jgi:hypothetical protein
MHRHGAGGDSGAATVEPHPYSIMNPNAYRILIKYEVKPATPAGWLKKGKAIGAVTTANASTFTSIVTLVQGVATATQALDALQAQAANKALDVTTARNAAVIVLQKAIKAYGAGVQGLCNAAPDAEHATAIAVAGGLAVKKKSLYAKPPFYGKALGNGLVHLFVKVPGKRSARVYYQWQTSPDGHTWTALPGTNVANLRVPNLTPATTVYFRSCTTIKNVVSAWSQTISILVT